MANQLTSLTEAAGRLGEMGTEMLGDRLELLSLELQEIKIRFVQLDIFVSASMVFLLFGLIVLTYAALYALPPEWRMYSLLGCAMLSLITGFIFFFLLRQLLKTTSLPFRDSLNELKKDVECFSTRN